MHRANRTGATPKQPKDRSLTLLKVYEGSTITPDATRKGTGIYARVTLVVRGRTSIKTRDGQWGLTSEPQSARQEKTQDTNDTNQKGRRSAEEAKALSTEAGHVGLLTRSAC